MDEQFIGKEGRLNVETEIGYQGYNQEATAIALSTNWVLEM